MLSGSCLCGAVTYTVSGNIQESSACHCSQCRKQSGHYWASANVKEHQLHITRDDGLTWYQATKHAKRGFCRICGSYLFWTGPHDDTIAFSLGSLDGPSGVTLQKHIFVADKGDYYDIADGLPQDMDETV